MKDCEYDVTGLVEGTDYHFRVSAENAAGSSPHSKELGPITAKKPATPIKFVKPLEDQEVKVSISYRAIKCYRKTLILYCAI